MPTHDTENHKKIKREADWSGRLRFEHESEKNLSYSGISLQPFYRAEDTQFLPLPPPPGAYPYTRGIHEGMYRDRPWTRRQYAGFGTGEDSNQWFKDLLSKGQTGLSVALDLPTQMGLDSTDPLGKHEVGRVGVAIDSLADMEALFEGIPLDKVSTSFTVNGTAAIIMAMYLVTAEKQGVPPEQIRGTVQNDILKEFVARGTYLFPPAPSLRIAGDIIEYGITKAPKFNTISISQAHMKSAGATLIQADAYMFANTIAYIEEVTRRGYQLDDFGQQLSFLQCVNRDFFESIARLRAARRYWAELAHNRYGSQHDKVQKYRIHSGGDTDSMTFERPYANIGRIALTCLSAVLGGAQSIQLPCYDEAYEIPTEEAIQNALDVQMIVAFESGVSKVVDPLAGSYYVEKLTADVLTEFTRIVNDIVNTGGMVRWIEEGRLQHKIAEEAYQWEKRLKTGEEVMVAANFARDDKPRSEYETMMHPYQDKTLEQQTARIARIKQDRDSAKLEQALNALESCTHKGTNLMEPITEAVRSYATIGEICHTLKQCFGHYRAPTGV
ncbi:MAG: methylmalonyl-CoA mutase family protein [Gammaproteobacteria bacterium]|nr:methylmalonyl-CoA mutase family protein [Gammaproteobacteria bacterium]